jgi:NAD-dependent deacetylase
MNKILVFTGAGVSAESGIETFRTGPDGLWQNHRVEDVATPGGWLRNKELVLNFYNKRRAQLKDVEPNLAHKIISDLEKDFDVTVVTQNVDNLHERAGSSNVIHLHGELTKVISTLDPSLVYQWEGDCNIGDKCDKGSQLRPMVTWFGEELDESITDSAKIAASNADVCIVVGTSMKVSPANTIPFLTKETALIYCVDPSEIDFYIPEYRRPFSYHIKDVASVGMKTVYDDLIKIYKK